MRLIIMEKPKMGRAVADYLGVIKSRSNYIETKGGIVAWLRGHVLEQAPPGAYGAGRFPGPPSDLPILPKKWILNVCEDTKGLLDTVKSLVERKDVTEIINGGDPDREGQMLVDEVLEFIGNTKPVKRLWLNATNSSAMDKAFSDLKSNNQYKNLYHAAVARSRADWLVGMSMSRLSSLIAGTGVFSIGRVQTPVLALIAARQKEREKFVVKDFFVPVLTVKTAKGSFMAEWVDKEDAKLDQQTAETIAKGAKNANVVLDVTRKKERMLPPMPWSLSTLQVWAGRSLGLKPAETLAQVQSLYEEGYVTYPRVDCEYYPEEEHKNASKILRLLTSSFVKEAKDADSSLKSRAWNTSKTTAHHAIMPTDRIPGQNLGPVAKGIYDAIARVYVAQFFSPLLLDTVKIQFEAAAQPFSANGKSLTDPGWSVVWPLKLRETTLPDVNTGDKGVVTDSRVDKRQTKPPELFTVSSIISVMKNVARYIEDAEAKKILTDTDGIGTEATRADIVEKLLKREYVTLDGKGTDKSLVVTEKGFRVLEMIPARVKDPVMTALWERELGEVAEGKKPFETFLSGIEKELKSWCEDGKKQIRGPYVSSFSENKFSSAKKSFGSTKSKTSVSTKSKSTVPSKSTNTKKGSATKTLANKYGKCPKCSSTLSLRKGSFGDFIGCTGYPNCRYTQKVQK
jgi:DNA topoisomerase-3